MTKIYVPCLCVTLLCFVSEFLDLNVFLHWLQGIATSCKWLISMWLLIAPIISSFPNVFEWRSQDCLIDDDDLRRMANVNGHASNVLWRDVDGGVGWQILCDAALQVGVDISRGNFQSQKVTTEQIFKFSFSWHSKYVSWQNRIYEIEFRLDKRILKKSY